MKQHSAIIFGKNDYTFELEKSISDNFKDIHVLKLDDEDGFDLSDNWDNLSSKIDMSDSVAVCVLEDMAQNIFLTISLRDTFEDLVIIALAEDKESEDKLMLAGASRVLPTISTTANVIVEMLEKPIVTKVLHNILYEESDLQIAQIKVTNHELFYGKYPADIDWSREHGIIVLSIVHEDMHSEFIYASKEKHHIINSGDIFVVVGYKQDIENFEKLIGSAHE